MNRTILSLLLLFCVSAAVADKFEVKSVAGKPVYLNGQPLSEGMIIDSNTNLTLDADNVIVVFNKSKKDKKFTIAGSNYKKNNCRSFGDYFSTRVGAHSRADREPAFLSEIFGGIFYWEDEVAVTSFYPKNANRVFALEIIDGLESSHTVQLPTDNDGRSFTLPANLLYANKTPYPLVANLLVGIVDPSTGEIAYERIVENAIIIPILNQ